MLFIQRETAADHGSKMKHHSDDEGREVSPLLECCTAGKAYGVKQIKKNTLFLEQDLVMQRTQRSGMWRCDSLQHLHFNHSADAPV